MFPLEKKFKEFVSDTFITDEPMFKHTAMKVGGNAKIFFTPRDETEIVKCIVFTKNENIPLYPLGQGSNIIVKDSGINGIVMKIFSLKRLFIDEKNLTVYVGSGFVLGRLIKKLSELGYSCLENLYGIPGTVGGAVYMNAGAFGSDISKNILKARTIDKEGKIAEHNTVEREKYFSYRNSIFQNTGEIVTEISLRAEKIDKTILQDKLENIISVRKIKQPLNFPSAGSTFKNPSNAPNGWSAGKLIEESGLKGAKIGGAMISDIHANFIVNTGNASSEDILSLIEKIQINVRRKFNIFLEPEVEIWGK